MSVEPNTSTEMKEDHPVFKRKTEMTFQRTEKMGNVSFGEQRCYFGIVGTV